MKGALKAIFDNFRFVTQRFDQTIRDMQRKGALPADYADPALDTAKTVIAAFDGEVPAEQQLGSYPLIIYFRSLDDRAQFSAVVQGQLKPEAIIETPRGVKVSRK